MLDWDNPLENQNNSKDDMKLTVVSQSLKETSLKNNNETITGTHRGESSATELKVVSNKLIFEEGVHNSDSHDSIWYAQRKLLDWNK